MVFSAGYIGQDFGVGQVITLPGLKGRLTLPASLVAKQAEARRPRTFCPAPGPFRYQCFLASQTVGQRILSGRMRRGRKSAVHRPGLTSAFYEPALGIRAHKIARLDNWVGSGVLFGLNKTEVLKCEKQLILG